MIVVNCQFNNRNMRFLTLLLLNIFIIIFLSCSNKNSSGRGIENSQLSDSINVMIEYGRVPNSVSGSSTRTPKEYLTMNWIIKNSSNKELEQMFYNPNANIRCIAFIGITKRKDTDIFKFFTEVLRDDSTKVPFMHLCYTIGGFCYEYLIHDVEDNLAIYFTKEQIVEIGLIRKGKSYDCN